MSLNREQKLSYTFQVEFWCKLKIKSKCNIIFFFKQKQNTKQNKKKINVFLSLTFSKTMLFLDLIC